jgi:acetaldehyde dehydrogenase (acetylating)
LGVGPGNVPAYIHSSADVPAAVRMVISSKTFDNGTICSSEQAIVTDRRIAPQVIRELQKNHAHFLNEEETEKLARILITPRGTISAKLIGRSAEVIAHAAGITIPPETKVLMIRQVSVGPEFPLSREKLSPVLAYYEVDDAEEGCRMCISLLKLGGLGHSLVLHAQDEKVIEEFALKKPVSRLLVNTPSSQGAIGYTTGLIPSLTLGCGTFGGNATSDNITATHLINIKRVARHMPDRSAIPQAADTAEKASSSIDVGSIRRMVEQALQRMKS